MMPHHGALLVANASSVPVSSGMCNIIMGCPKVGVMGRGGWMVPNPLCWSGLMFSVP